MTKISFIVCAAMLAALVVAHPNPGLGDQIKDIGFDTDSIPNFGLDTGSLPDLGLDTGSVPDLGSLRCKGSEIGGGKPKKGFPGMNKIPGFDKIGGSDCTSEASTDADSGTTTEATTVEASAPSL